MSTDMDYAVYSLQDVINALLEHDSDGAWDFASDLTGLSTDRLAELVNANTPDEQDLKVMSYEASPLCMALMNGSDDTITVCFGEDIGNETIMPIYCAFLDENNFPGIGKRLEKAGIAEPYTRFGTPVAAESGFCTYPLFRFNAERLREMDHEGLAEYEGAYCKRADSLRGRTNNEKR